MDQTGNGLNSPPPAGAEREAGMASGDQAAQAQVIMVQARPERAGGEGLIDSHHPPTESPRGRRLSIVSQAKRAFQLSQGMMVSLDN